MPIVVSAMFVLIALCVLHALLGWHKHDMNGRPGEHTSLDALRAANVRPGDTRFPFGRTVAELTTPEFEAKMRRGRVGNMSVVPNGDANMG